MTEKRTNEPASIRPIFTIQLRAEPGIDAVRALRGLLKLALRRFGLRVVSIDEQTP